MTTWCGSYIRSEDVGFEGSMDLLDETREGVSGVHCSYIVMAVSRNENEIRYVSTRGEFMGMRIVWVMTSTSGVRG
jgi:hypothetical protein